LNCRNCQEIVAAVERRAGGLAGGPLPEGAAGHLARCPECREFREDLWAVGAALAAWELPPVDADRRRAAQQALAERLATPRPAAGRRSIVRRAIDQPALLGLLGAAAAAAGVAASPAWLQQVAAGWAAGAALFASTVLLLHGRSMVFQGERL
jgi:hypothetical protein